MLNKLKLLYRAIIDIFFTKDGEATIPKKKQFEIGGFVPKENNTEPIVKPFSDKPQFKYVCPNCLMVVQELLDYISINCPENFDVVFFEKDLFNLADIFHRGEWKEVPEYYSKNLLKGILLYIASKDESDLYIEASKIRDILNNKTLTNK